jgi:hypothetical protein
MKFQEQIQAKTRAGNITLFRYDSPLFLQMKEELKSQERPPIDKLVSYEDRHQWVRDVLEAKDIESFTKSIFDNISRLFPGDNIKEADILAIAVGQEEDVSSGYPIRFVKIWWLVKSSP